jgi:predicted PurR-regulated permease PerM
MTPTTPPDRFRPAVLFRWGVFFSLGAAAAIIGLYALYSVRAVLIRVLVAMFIAVSLDPAVRLLTRRGLRRGWAVTLIFVLFLVATAGFLLSVIPPLVTQFRALLDDLPGYLTTLQRRSGQFRELNDRFDLSSRLQGVIGGLPAQLGSGVLGVTGRVFGALFSTLTVLVFTIYFMADLPRLEHGLVYLFPAERRERAGQVVDLVVDKVGGYMIGNIIISIIAGLASYAAFRVLGMPFALPLAFLVGVFDMIPQIGATLGAVVVVLVALFTTELWPTTVLVAAFFVAYQQLENYLIAPRVLRTTVELGAAAVLLAGLIGATVLGLVGALMAIPIAAAFNVLLNQRLAAREAAATLVGGAAQPSPPGAPGGAEPPAPPPAAETAPPAGDQVRGSGSGAPR